MQRYEVIVIVLANLNDEDITALIERSQTIITDRKGVIAKIENGEKDILPMKSKNKKTVIIFLSISPVMVLLSRKLKEIIKLTTAS